jgi:putative flippase GtrA
MLGPLRAIDRLIARLPFSPRLVRFGLVGTSGVGVNFAILALLEAILPPTWGLWRHRSAMAAAIAVSIFTNFLLHHGWTWADRRGQATATGWFGRLGRFYLVSLVGAGVQWVVAVLAFERLIVPGGLVPVFGVLAPFVAQSIGIVAGMAVNFTANHFWTFREAPP